MRSLFQFLFLVGFASISWAQIEWSAPDYQSIKKEITDKNSPYFYPNLLDKLKNKSGDLTSEDFKHLYYGHRYQANYNPYGTSDLEKEIEEKMETDFNPDGFRDILNLIEKSLKENPINLKLYLYSSFFHNSLGNKEKSDELAEIYFGFLVILLTSGDGHSCETAFHVLSVHDEYELLETLELKSKGQALMGNCDLIQLVDNTDGIEELYFDISVPFASLNDLFK